MIDDYLSTRDNLLLLSIITEEGMESMVQQYWDRMQKSKLQLDSQLREKQTIDYLKNKYNAYL